MSLSPILSGALHTLPSPLGQGGALLGTGVGALASAGAGAVASGALATLDSWVLSGTRGALALTAKVIGTATAPQLSSTWFSATYWRVAALSALLTVPFLFAAAVQALLRSDLTVLARAAFVYLPVSVLGVTLAAPLTMLLLAATDQMCAAVSPAGIGGGAHFLANTAILVGGTGALAGSGFLAFAVGLFTAAAAITLAVEMLAREAAVYIVVLMLPLAFAAMVWPARRAWIVRMVEVLAALILSKFAVVAVLSLAGAAYGSDGVSSTRLLTAMALLVLSAFAPWAMLRLLPFAELAEGASGAMRAGISTARHTAGSAADFADMAVDWPAGISARLRRDAGEADPAGAQTVSDRPPGASPSTSTSTSTSMETAAAAQPASAQEPAAAQEPPGPDAGEQRPGQRLPGDEAHWQTADQTWKPLDLSPANGWPPVIELAQDEEEPR
jgi:hypothetical protein